MRLQHLAGLIIISIFISACGSNSNVVSNSIIQKRKHTKGFYVDVFSKRKENAALQKIEHKNLEISATNFEQTEHIESITELSKDRNDVELDSNLKNSNYEHLKAFYLDNAAGAETIKDVFKNRKLFREEVKSIYSPSKPEDGIEKDSDEKGDYVGLAIAGFVLSLVGLIVFGLIAGILAIVFGIVGFAKAEKENRKGKGLAIAAIIIGFLDIILTIIGLIALSSAGVI